MSTLSLTKPARSGSDSTGQPAKSNPAKRSGHDRTPMVNLLSQWTLDALRARRLRHRFEAAALGLCLLLLAGWWLQHVRVAEAEQQLAVHQVETTRLTAEADALAEVREFVGMVEQRKTLAQETMSTQVDFSGVLGDLGRRTPVGVELDSAVVTLTPTLTGATAGETASGTAAPDALAVPGQQVSSCPGPDPFNTRTVVGCITLSGTADSRASVGDFVIHLGEGSRFVEPFVSTTTTADGQGVTFSGSVGLSERVFSKRYRNMDRFLNQGEQS